MDIKAKPVRKPEILAAEEKFKQVLAKHNRKHLIIYTMPDGSVSIDAPSTAAITAMLRKLGNDIHIKTAMEQALTLIHNDEYERQKHSKYLIDPLIEDLEQD